MHLRARGSIENRELSQIILTEMIGVWMKKKEISSKLNRHFNSNHDGWKNLIGRFYSGTRTENRYFARSKTGTEPIFFRSRDNFSTFVVNNFFVPQSESLERVN
jgi:hypothetical protein